MAAPEEPAVPPDLAMPFLLMSAFRHLVDAVHADLAEAGMPDVRTTHGVAMQAIGEGCTAVELGHRLGVTKQAAAKSASSLESLGFIQKVPGSSDRRERRLVPTAKGRRMLELSAAAFVRQVRRWRDVAGEEAVDATLMALSLVAEAPDRTG